MITQTVIDASPQVLEFTYDPLSFSLLDSLLAFSFSDIHNTLVIQLSPYLVTNLPRVRLWQTLI